MKRRLMRCDSAVSEVVGTVLMLGLISICFGILYVQVIPQFQSYSEMLRIYPSVSSVLENNRLTLMMQSGLPTESWVLYVDGVQVQDGVGFAVGIPISYTFQHNSTHDVSLIENSASGYSRMIYFARMTTNGTSTPPEEPGNPYLNESSWNERNGRGGYSQNGTSVEFVDSLSDEPGYWWDCPLDTTTTFTVRVTMMEKHNVYSSSFISVGICGENRDNRISGMYSATADYNEGNYANGYWCSSAGSYYQLYSPFNAIDKNRTWEMTIDTISHTVSYSIYEGSSQIGVTQVLGYCDAPIDTIPNHIFIYTSRDFTCRVLVSNIEVN